MRAFQGLTFKVSRDPIHSEIRIYPLELAFVDSPLLQRLRGLSQLCGAQLAYPGATHTRFAHSLGTMYVSGAYADSLWGDDPAKVTLIRLAGLLHDVGHGPFSHQFDDSILKHTKYKDHDGYRLKLLKEVAPNLALETISTFPEHLREQVKVQLKWVTSSDELSESNLSQLIERVLAVYEGEESGTPEFNVVQGLLGADRLDFLLRDAFFSGTLHFGGAPIDRLTRNAKVIDNKLAYSTKVIDDIYSVLFTRFMMYKNVYFHKLGRAADMMVQEILRRSKDFVDYNSILENPLNYLSLTDQKLLTIIELKAMEREDSELLDLINRYRFRKTWKLLMEVPFSMEGVDPIAYVQAFEEETLRHIRELLRDLLDGEENSLEGNRFNLSESDKELLEDVISAPERFIKIDAPFRLTLVEPKEFYDTNLLLYDGVLDKVMTFDEFIRTWPTYKLFREGPVQLLRIYVTDNRLRDILLIVKGKLFMRLKGKSVTRW